MYGSSISQESLLEYITINGRKRAFLNRRPGSARRVAVIAIFASDRTIFFHGVRVNWKQKHLSDWFVFEITFLLWRWRHKIQNTHAINFQTRASLVRDFCCSEVKKKKKSPREKKFQFFSILVFPTTKTLMKWTTTHATIVPVF